MKKYTILLILLTSALISCNTSKLAQVSDEERGEISWNAFCDARGYDRNDNTFTATNEYLDTWCGTTEEENAFIKAGIKPE
ncbi:MAG: hypothetical protein HDT24_04470 [Ruminococcus sp.]|nr:hypothetical protein [Ruminococcus sp.]